RGGRAPGGEAMVASRMLMVESLRCREKVRVARAAKPRWPLLSLSDVLTRRLLLLMLRGRRGLEAYSPALEAWLLGRDRRAGWRGPARRDCRTRAPRASGARRPRAPRRPGKPPRRSRGPATEARRGCTAVTR